MVQRVYRWGTTRAPRVLSFSAKSLVTRPGACRTRQRYESFLTSASACSFTGCRCARALRAAGVDLVEVRDEPIIALDEHLGVGLRRPPTQLGLDACRVEHELETNARLASNDRPYWAGGTAQCRSQRFLAALTVLVPSLYLTFVRHIENIWRHSRILHHCESQPAISRARHGAVA
jgi:hypothetical protein